MPPDDRKGEPADKEFRRWFEVQLKGYLVIAGKIVATGEEHVPLMFAYPADKRESPVLMPVGTMPDLMEDKDRLARFHRFVARAPFVYACVLIMEAWTLLTDRDKNLDEQLGKSIADHPERTEAIIVNAIHDRQQLFAMVPIDRVNKKLKEPKIIDPFKDMAMEGRMILNVPTKH